LGHLKMFYQEKDLTNKMQYKNKLGNTWHPLKRNT
jgi:hypothetical protein